MRAPGQVSALFESAPCASHWADPASPGADVGGPSADVGDISAACEHTALRAASCAFPPLTLPPHEDVATFTVGFFR